MGHDEMVKQIVSVCDIYTDDLIASTGATQLILGIVKQRIAQLESENAALKTALQTSYAILSATLKDAAKENAALKAERDAARAWAAAWKRAAHMHREYQDTFGYVGASVSANRRALRALRAAEAMERR